MEYQIKTIPDEDFYYTSPRPDDQLAPFWDILIFLIRHIFPKTFLRLVFRWVTSFATAHWNFRVWSAGAPSIGIRGGPKMLLLLWLTTSLTTSTSHVLVLWRKNLYTLWHIFMIRSPSTARTTLKGKNYSPPGHFGHRPSFLFPTPYQPGNPESCFLPNPAKSDRIWVASGRGPFQEILQPPINVW